MTHVTNAKDQQIQDVKNFSAKIVAALLVIFIVVNAVGVYFSNNSSTESTNGRAAAEATRDLVSVFIRANDATVCRSAFSGATSVSKVHLDSALVDLQLAFGDGIRGGITDNQPLVDDAVRRYVFYRVLVDERRVAYTASDDEFQALLKLQETNPTEFRARCVTGPTG